MAVRNLVTEMPLTLEEEPPLFTACLLRDTDLVRKLLLRNEDVNFVDCQKHSPLHIASYSGCGELVDLLVMSGARVNCKDSRWLTPLHRACRQDNEDAAEALLHHGADLTARDANWRTPLHMAAAENASRCMVYLLSLMAGVEIADKSGRTSLHHAVFNGHVEATKMLLTSGANVDAADKRGRRPLHWAAYMGQLNVVELLLTFGATVDSRDKLMHTPLHAAACSGKVEVVTLLLSAGADIEACTSSGNSCLHLACLNGQHMLVSELPSYSSALVHAVNHVGQTAVHIAAGSVNGAMCLESLLSRGACPNAKSSDGRTPLHVASILGRYTRAVGLLEAGAEINSVDKDNNTPLHLACRYNHQVLAATFIAYQADLFVKGAYGMLPVHVAALYGSTPCLRILCDTVPSMLSKVDERGRSCLHAAACSGNIEAIKTVLSHGADVNVVDKLRRAPLHYAAGVSEEACWLLISAGSYVNAADSQLCTPLHYASSSNCSPSIVECLLRNGADVMARDRPEGYLPIHYAACFGRTLSLKMASVKSTTCSMFKNTNKNSAVNTNVMAQLAAFEAWNGHNDVVIEMAKLFDVDAVDDLDRTALHLAAFRGHVACCELLVKCGSNPTLLDVYQLAPIHYAANRGNVDCVRAMIKFAYAVDCRSGANWTPLMFASVNCHADTVTCLISAGASVDAVDGSGHSALHLAAASGNDDWTEKLLQLSADVNARDSRGRTPLHVAAMCGNVHFIGYLIMTGCLVNPRDNDGFTPLHLACYRGHESCVSLLLHHIDVKGKQYGSRLSPLHCAVLMGNNDIAGVLLKEWGTEILYKADESGRTAMHAAIFAANKDAVSLLHSNGADVNRTDFRGRTPLMYAVLYIKNNKTSADFVDALLRIGADVDVFDYDRNTALHLACVLKKDLSAVALVNAMTNIDVPNESQKTPLHIAAQRGLVAVVRSLLAKGASVFVRDAQGRTPAVCCASNSRTAQCLSAVVLQMMEIRSFASMSVLSEGSSAAVVVEQQEL